MWKINYQEDGSISAAAKNIQIATDRPGVEGVTLNIAKEFTLATLPVQLGELSETMALAEKRRPHLSEENNEITLDQENHIPFGTEPFVKRKIRVSEQLLNVTMDIEMRNSTEMKSISGGGVVISGPIVQFAFLTLPGKGASVPSLQEFQEFKPVPEDTVLFDEAYPPLGLIVKSGKSILDFMIGDDFWRWTNAERIGGTARFTVIKKGQSLFFHWQLFTLTPDTEMPAGRNWRLTWGASWRPAIVKRAKKIAFKSTFSLESFEWPEASCALQTLKKSSKKSKTAKSPVCMCSSGALNVLKKWLRSNLSAVEEGDIFAVTSVVPHYCVNAGHMERAKFSSLPHWDMASLLEFKRWANRQLVSKGARLELIAPADSPLKGFMTLL